MKSNKESKSERQKEGKNKERKEGGDDGLRKEREEKKLKCEGPVFLQNSTICTAIT